MKIQLYLILIVGLLFSCNNGEEQPFANPTQINEYFSLKGFMDRQISQLDGKKVEKWSKINGEEKRETVYLDEEAWRRELDLFIQSDINKASLKDAYQTQRKDGQQIHQLKPDREAQVKNITITYLDGSENVKEIAFIASKENFFYQSSTQATISIDPETKTINSYKIESQQKVWFLSPNKIEIKGEVMP
ncbi:hypothetical protein QWY93_06585 [Echinicola jeungdonensis]|uniref:hypothetical protein n=1 Tax=Echinicola jeungdonensis TaxID=709343 RepID=UPI0025B4C944|nr:hypothetical protein [Echinicola jeungdonensis]MDN3668989.1 hypothetical protein [Echinicola jeungdonensis]